MLFPLSVFVYQLEFAKSIEEDVVGLGEQTC